jgi:FkbM family methyltransferase
MIGTILGKLRRSAFDFPVRGGGTVGDIICAPLDATGVEPVVVDVGARNGMALLPASYTARARLIGFEANRAEYDKLISGTTDARKIGAFNPSFKREEYHPYAVWRAREQRPFYITEGAGACTLMGAPEQTVTETMYLDYRNKLRGRSYYDLHVKILRTEPVDCITLDEVLPPDTTFDFMKLDVEGAELAALEGASKLLEAHRALFIFSEFVTFPYYKMHDVMGSQHVFLNERGYRLLDLELEHPTYRRGRRDLPESTDRRMMYAGDAFFVVDPDRHNMDALTRQRLAAISMAFGFASFALSLIDDAGLTSAADVAQIEEALRRTYTARRLMHIWRFLPRQTMRRLGL